MGAVFFMVFLAIIFFVALFFIVVNTILIIVWNTKKRKGKPSRKRWLIIPVFLLVFNIIVALLPVGYIGFLRYVNSSNKPDIVNVESGKVLYWPSTDDGWTTTWFEMDGKKYVEFREGNSDDPFFLDCGRETLGEPIAQLKIRASDSDNAFNDFMWRLLSGSTYAEQNVSTLYPIKNDNNFNLIYAENSPGSPTIAGGAFCEEESLKEAKIYYEDISNYDTQNLLCTYTVYYENEQSGEQNDAPYINMKKTIVVNSDTFEQLWEIHNDDKDSKHVQIPEKNEERCIQVYSKDKMVSLQIYLILFENQVYTMHTVGGGYMTGCILPPDINQYIIDNVFMTTSQ